MKQTIKTLSNHKGTTVVGLSSSLIGTLILLLPEDVRTGCLDAINNSNSPLLVGILLMLGVGGTIIGPSIVNRRSQIETREDSN